jgi:CNT family concentrative nucleoside transporter
MIARILIPETQPATAGEATPPRTATGSMEAVVQGTMEGLTLLLQIAAMLIVLIALVFLVNGILGWFPDAGGTPLTLQRILGWVMTPVMWLIGIPWQESATAGTLMGTKTVLNELIAYADLAKLPPEALSPKSRIVMVYALCGFANLGSLGT